MVISNRLGWRKRTWAFLIWTALAIAGGITARFTVERRRYVGGSEDYSGWSYFLIFLAWFVGILFIWGAGLLSDELRYRRDMHAISKGRRGEPRRF